MFPLFHLSDLLAAAGCLLAGMAAGYLLGKHSSGGNRSQVVPQGDATPAVQQQRIRLTTLVRDLSGSLTPSTTVRQQLEEMQRLIDQQACDLERVILDSRTDPLTGLSNRRALDERVALLVSACQRYGHPLSVAIADIDHFKQLNDRYGHTAGDEVLQQIGTLLRQSLREADFVARYGGEEFVVLLTETDLAGARLATERIRQSISSRTFSIRGLTLTLSISAGIAQLRPGENFTEALGRADAALFQAKQAGRNQTRTAD